MIETSDMNGISGLESGETAPPLAPIPRLLLTPNEAAIALRISARLLWARTKAGEIPCVRIGKCVRYNPHDLAEWIERAKVQ